MLKLLVAFVLFSVLCASLALEEGDSCVSRAGPGICTKICPNLLKRLGNNVINQVTVCKPKTRIYCCPNPPLKLERPLSNRTSAQKCRDYAKRKDEKCPLVSVSLVIGGTIAADKEFPHMALIGYKKSQDDFTYMCGGSLISEKFILSAAHCAYSSELKQATHAKLGDVRRGEDNPNILLVHIEERYKQPEYKYNSIDHDIALFKLREYVELNDYIRPICLPTIDEEIEEATVTGWGLLGYGSAVSKHLMKVTLDIFNETDCQSKFDRSSKTINGIDYRTKICAGSYEDKKDSCNGDSGGPLQIFNRDNVFCMYTMIGVVSYGLANCGSIGIPGIYTRVFPYLDWIENIVWSNITN